MLSLRPLHPNRGAGRPVGRAMALLALCAACDATEELSQDAGPCASRAGRVLAIDWTRTRFGSVPPEVQLAQRAQRLHPCTEDHDDVGDSDDAGGEDAGPSGPKVDWNWTTNDPVTSTPAIRVANFPNSSSADQLFVCTNATSGTNFYSLNSLYGASPNVMWSASTGGCDGSNVALMTDGAKVFALTQDGTVTCFAPANGAVCNGWPAQTYSIGRTVSRTSPWMGVGTYIYYGDNNGYLSKLDTRDRTLVWEVDLDGFLPSPCVSGCNSFAIRGSPVAYSGYIYVGNDAGAVCRVTDTASTPTSSDITNTHLHLELTGKMGIILAHPIPAAGKRVAIFL